MASIGSLAISRMGPLRSSQARTLHSPFQKASRHRPQHWSRSSQLESIVIVAVAAAAITPLIAITTIIIHQMITILFILYIYSFNLSKINKILYLFINNKLILNIHIYSLFIIYNYIKYIYIYIYHYVSLINYYY